jgi:hypothetical protein
LLECCCGVLFAAGALEAAQQDAAKERAARQRHEDVSGEKKVVSRSIPRCHIAVLLRAQQV